MSLHGLTHVEMGVPDVSATRSYYTDFGLTPAADGWMATSEGGNQLRISHAPRRQILQIGIRADDPDDLARIASNLRALGVASSVSGTTLTTHEPASGFTVTVEVVPRLRQIAIERTHYNGPGRVERSGRAPGILRSHPVRPHRLGHVVAGTTDLEATQRFFTDGLGFKVSDYIAGEGAFMRCSTDHHNVLVMRAPINYLHHTSWQVDDIDDVGRGAFAMLQGHPERHVWGLGRHHAGSNFFWYLKDPAGNFSEYFSDMDVIPEDEIWKPEVLQGALGLFNWGPPPPPSFLNPDDLASMMTGNHSKR